MKVEKYSKQLDWTLLLVSFILTLGGTFFVYSSSVDIYGVPVSNEWVKQIIWAVITFGIIIFISFLPSMFFTEIGHIIYWGSVIGLLLTALFGTVINGAKAWLSIGSISLQFSEFGKIGFILLLGVTLEKNRSFINSFSGILRCLAVFVIPFLFVLLQPDLGTAIIYIFIFFVMVSVGGVDARALIFLILLLVFTLLFFLLPLGSNASLGGTGKNFINLMGQWRYLKVPFYSLVSIFFLAVVTNYYYRNTWLRRIIYAGSILLIAFGATLLAHSFLKPYHIQRILVTLDPQLDPRGVGWNVTQSMTAIGSGGLFGKGFLLGTQSHLNYIPEQSTDFIVSLILEEKGLLGGLILILLYSVLIMRIFYLAMRSSQPFIRYTLSGIGAYFFIHIFINVGMNLGILPVIGIPLLFISYGGSSILSAGLAIGVANMLYREEISLDKNRG